jgi:hypothetical protein
MSGYLQRLVLNATAGGGDGARPRTGSIFSPRVEEAPAPLHDSHDTEHAASPQAAELAEPANPVVRGSHPAPLFPTASEATAAPTIKPAPPLVRAASPHDVETVVHSGEPARELRRVDRQRPPEVHAVAAIARDPAEPSSVVATQSRVLEPRVRSAEPAHRSSGRQVAQRERQPDDIQIHIGRIEVIAVPPPAPRVPKAPERSVSLEAYLNRHDRRPR